MPLTDDEIAQLSATPDIIALGLRADEARRERHGLRTTFVRVAQVGVSGSDPLAWPTAAGEIRITGTPETGMAAMDRVRSVAGRLAGVPVSGFSLADLEQLAARERVTLRGLLEELRSAGLELVADAAVDRLQDARQSIEEVNIAGLALARLTVDQLPPDPARLFSRVAALQHDVAVIRAFAPLPRRLNPAAPTTGYDDVRSVALARLVVDNVPSIQVDWSRYGPKLAQVALTVGADDVDALWAEEDASQGRRRAPLEEIRRNIRAAGQEPVERNGRFEVLAVARGGTAT